MFYYKFSCLILLMLSVICLSCDDPDTIRHNNNIIRNIRKHTRGKRKLNDYSICLQSMTDVFEENKLPLGCIRHAIYFMKLYGVHRSKYPIHAILYYQEFHKYVTYGNIMLPYTFCFTSEGFLNKTCYRELEIFNKEMSQDDVFKDYGTEELKLLLSKASGSNQGESGSSQSEEQHPSVEPPAKPFEFGHDDIQLIQDKFPTFVPDSSVEPPAIQSEEQPELQTMQLIVLKNALYYHKVGEIPEEVGLTDESRKFIHKKESYGDYYLRSVMEKIGLTSKNPKIVPGPDKFCRNLYPSQRKINIIDDPTES